jgi:uncharacterized LabA/DUF88 family protein
MSKSAVLVDGGFFLKRYRALYPNKSPYNVKEVARDLYGGVLRDIRAASRGVGQKDLYRVLYYDCPPLMIRAQNPVSKKNFSFKDTDEAKFRIAFLDELKRFRKVAIRLGRMSDNGQWVVRPSLTKPLINGKVKLEELKENDVRFDATQKGVDMKIGLDIASISYKKPVDQIILISGDSDFVPAAKLARREGIDFLLDPMWNNINPDLHEHIDGLISKWPKPEGRN